LRLLADAFHSAQTQEDFAAVISNRLPLIGHVQVADTNGRHEPGTGDIDWRPIMSALRQHGYQGHIGLEYFPSMPDRASLEASRRALDMVE
jgi:hydroxypyruvate isomerase